VGHLFQKLFFALGGFSRWFFCIILNLFLDKNHKTNIGYYLYENKQIDKNSMDSNKWNFVFGIITFVLLITLLGLAE